MIPYEEYQQRLRQSHRDKARHFAEALTICGNTRFVRWNPPMREETPELKAEANRLWPARYRATVGKGGEA